MNKKKIILIIFLAILLIGGGMYFYFHFHRNKPSAKMPTPSPSTMVTPTASSSASSTSSTNQPQLLSLEELKAKTANWPIYENQDYKFKVKYPPGWNHYDKNTFPYGMPGQLVYYKATEIFRTNKPLDGPDDGVLINVFISNDLSLIPTKESIVYRFEHDYTWHIAHQFKTFSLSNGFEGTVVLAEDKEGRTQIGESFHQINGRVVYIGWYLNEDYQNGKSDYSSISYQNQFLPFLASFEIIQ
jgi:hypothetical protein